MNSDSIKKLLQSVADGKTPVDNAVDEIKKLPFEDIDFAHIDHHRSLRKGFPEVIFGEGKSAEQICGILEHMIPREAVILITRVDTDKAARVLDRFPRAEVHSFKDAGHYILEDIPEKVLERTLAFFDRQPVNREL